jgi:zinc protease
MIKPLLLSLSLCASLAYAEGGVVTAGPLTSLNKLDSFQSVKNAATPRRSIAIQQWHTSNGTNVLFVAANELPMVDVRVLFNAGSARDGNKFGLASLVSRMLDEGTTTRNTDQIASSFENLGASFNVSAYRDMFLVDLRVLSENNYLEPALDVFSDVIAHPSFPEEPFKRIFDGAQIGQQQRQQSPAAQASILFYQNLYGKHPYAHPSNGTPESLKSISIDDLKAFHQRYFVAQNATIAIVGNVDTQAAKAISEKISSNLPKGTPAEPLPSGVTLDKARHKHLEFPSQQTHIMIGQATLRRDDPDYEALYVGNEIFGGGGFGSILMKELREKRGLTYGVYSLVSHASRRPF